MRRALVVLPLLLMLCGCLKKEIQTGLTEPEAQEIIVVLKEHGLDAVKQLSVGGEQKEPVWTVYVKGGDQNLVVHLVEAGYLHQPVVGFVAADL